MRSLFQHLSRIKNARRFSVPFTRRASFKVPGKITICGQVVPVKAPNERGIRNDFLTCFINDDYGLSALNQPIQSVIDLGANVGFFSMATRSYFPNAKIQSYEPNPRIKEYLLENAISTNFQPFFEAVGSADSFVLIDDSGDSNQARTVAVEANSISNSLNIQKTALSTVVERIGGQVDLAKIDCEGGEWDLFNDLATFQKIKHVRMEYHL